MSRQRHTPSPKSLWIKALVLALRLLTSSVECASGIGLTRQKTNGMNFVAHDWIFLLVLVLFVAMHLIKFSSGEPKGRKAGLKTEQPRTTPSAKPRGPSRSGLKLRLGSAPGALHLGIISKGDKG